MHGGNPKLEGKPTASKDAGGRSTRDLIDDALRGADGGVIWYTAVKPGNTAHQDKVSYVARFAPWRMVFIAGAWMDDVDATYRANLFRLCGIGGAILAVSLMLTWMINRDITGSLARLAGAMQRLARGDLTTAIPGSARRDEVGAMAQTVLVFQASMERVKLAAEQERASAPGLGETRGAGCHGGPDRDGDDESDQRCRHAHRRNDRDRGGDGRLGRPDRPFSGQRRDCLGAVHCRTRRRWPARPNN